MSYVSMFFEKFNRLNSEDIKILFYNVNKKARIHQDT